jgi:hypothetical protein
VLPRFLLGHQTHLVEINSTGDQRDVGILKDVLLGLVHYNNLVKPWVSEADELGNPTFIDNFYPVMGEHHGILPLEAADEPRENIVAVNQIISMAQQLLPKSKDAPDVIPPILSAVNEKEMSVYTKRS